MLIPLSYSATKIDTLLIKLQNNNDEVEKINILYLIGGELIERNTDSADLFLNQGLQLANRSLLNIDSKESEQKILLYKSNILSELGYVSYKDYEYRTAIKLLNQSISIKESIGDVSYKEKFFNHLGFCYYKLGNYKVSLEYFNKGLDANIGSNNYDQIANIYNAIAKNYFKLELYKEAEINYENVLIVRHKLKELDALLTAFNGIANVNISLKNWEKAESTLLKSKSIAKKNELDYTEEIMVLYAKIKLNNNEIDSAKIYLKNAELLAVNDKDEIELLKIHETYALLYLLDKEFDLGVDRANSMITLATKKKDKSSLSSAYKILYKIYEKQDDFKNAFINFQLYSSIQKKLAINDAKNLLYKEEQKLLFNQQTLEDSLKFEAVNLKKNAELENSKAELKAATFTKVVLFGGLFLLSIMLIGLFFSLKRKKRDHRFIIKKKLEVEEQQKLLAQQNLKLKSKAILYKILKVCSADQSIKSILNESLTELMEINIIGKQNKGCILLLDENSKPKLEVKKGLNENDLSNISLISLDECLCGKVYTSSKIEYCTPKDSQNHFNVPIIKNDIVQGIIILFTNLPEQDMIEAEEFLNSVSLLLGETIFRHKISNKLRIAHIENTIKKKEIQMAHSKADMALKKQKAINNLMNSILINENVGEQVYEYIHDILGGVKMRRLNITLFNFDEKTASFYFLRENGVDKIKNAIMPITDFSNETMNLLKVNKRVLVNSILDRKQKSESDLLMIRNNINSFASFPLMMEGDLLGALNISFENQIDFTDEQEEFFDMLIEGVTIAIHQSILFEEIKYKNLELSHLHTEISSSINYAQKLQLSVLPPENYFKSLFPDSFVILRQKDTVGGDFYWVKDFDNGIKMIACIDCTGHNIPGAFMTMLSRVLLREAATIKGLTKPSEILKQMDTAVRTLLRQDSYEAMQDGLDMTIAVLNTNTDTFSFSSAQRPIILKKKNSDSLEVVKGSKFPIGGYYEKEKIYINNEMKLSEISSFYMYSDGFTDQFGGPNIKKYGTNQFLSTINLINELSMNKQRQYLENELKHWKGELDQIDDISVVGIKL